MAQDGEEKSFGLKSQQRVTLISTRAVGVAARRAKKEDIEGGPACCSRAHAILDVRERHCLRRASAVADNEQERWEQGGKEQARRKGRA
jgi:hypothetical protein